MSIESQQNTVGDLTSGYERMLERIRAQLNEAEINAPLPVYMAIEEARERAVALGELTQNEAQQVATFVKRDLLHLRDILARAHQGVRTWLGIDLGMIEQGLLDVLADPARVDWLRLQQELEAEAQQSSAQTAETEQQNQADARDQP